MVKLVYCVHCEPEVNQAFVASRGLAPAYDGITEVWWTGDLASPGFYF